MDAEKKIGITFSGDLTPSQIAQVIVEKNRVNPEIELMKSADKYFSGHNETIEKKKRVYYDKNRTPIENPFASNARVKSKFLRMLVQQKQDYAFAKTFVMKLSTDEQEEINLSENEYGKAWKKFLNDSLFKLSYTLSGQAVNHGIAWAYPWIDEKGKLMLKDVPSTLIYPVWKDRQHTQLDRLIYNYSVESYRGSVNPTVEEYAEYWSDTERILFSVNDGYKEIPLAEDSSGNPFHSHMISGDGEGVSWGRIPFICFKGTDDEVPLLSFVREQVDSYDELSSRSVDGLVDDLDPILVVKGISPDVNDIIEAREIAKMTRTISLEDDGSANYIECKTNIEGNLKSKEDLRRDIIKFGYGVDYEDARFGGNPNQLVIKSLYQNMDTYCDGLERHFQDFINDFKYFFDKWYEFTGQGSFEESEKYRILVKLDRSMMINQSAQIDDCVKLANTCVSKKTQLEFNPVVQDVELEEERLKEEEKKSSKENSLFNFPEKENEEEKENPEEGKKLEEKEGEEK